MSSESRRQAAPGASSSSVTPGRVGGSAERRSLRASSRVEAQRRCPEHGFVSATDASNLAELGYRWHDLRHPCVSRLVAAGADVKVVQAGAGHANPLITLKRYSHLLDRRVTEAADRFDPAVLARP